MKTLSPSEFIEELKKYSRIALTAPSAPDGDSVGTQAALKEILNSIFPDKSIRIINEDPCPSRYRYLKEAPAFEMASDVLKTPNSQWPELMICVDGGATRVGDDTTKIWNSCKARAQIDHHAIGSGESYDFRLYDPKAAATTQLVFELTKSLNWKLTPSSAQALYTGLVFDTGMFKHSNTTPETMRIGAALLETGFDHTSTAEKAMLIRNEASLSLLKLLLNSMQWKHDSRFVSGVLHFQDVQKANAKPEDREGLIDVLFLTETCQVAAFFFEKAPGDWKLSFRARPPHNVAALAQRLTPRGGGHVLAAGCSLDGSFEKVSAQVFEEVSKLFAK